MMRHCPLLPFGREEAAARWRRFLDPVQPPTQKARKSMAHATNTEAWKFETKQLHIGQELPDPATDARAVPIYQTTSYVFKNCDQAAARFSLAESGNIYGRLTNSTQEVLEKRIAALEGGSAALALASGAAAGTYVFLNLARAGDHFVSAKTIYGGTYNLLAHTLPDYGIATTFVDPLEKDGFARAVRPNTRAIFIESLGNPHSNIIDIAEVAAVAHANAIPLVVDNTFATPYLLRPFEYGADIVIHSATKYIGGHGTTLGGIIVESGRFDWEASGKFPALTEPNPSYHGVRFSKAAGPAAFVTKIRAVLLRDTGAAISPLSAFLLLQGVETLSLRVERHVENALKVVAYLLGHSKVEKVNHPSLPDDPGFPLYRKYFPRGAGSIFSFGIKGGAKEARDFIDRLQIFSLLANVADVKSLVIHPASTTHSQLTEEELLDQGIRPNTVRLSIGTEHIDDILADLEQALA
jgi:O-acetylhomoserine (thiol)-lyase